MFSKIGSFVVSIILFVLVCTLTILPSRALSIIIWEPKAGDFLEVDVSRNVASLVREDNSESYSFPVATGQKRFVVYLGRHYFAETPIDTWEVKALEKSGDKVTFGKDGKFLRLYRETGQKRTSYGIHTHKYADVMIDSDNRYRSMGCILVKDEMLDLIEKTYLINNENLKVVTYKSGE